MACYFHVNSDKYQCKGVQNLYNSKASLCHNLHIPSLWSIFPYYNSKFPHKGHFHLEKHEKINSKWLSRWFPVFFQIKFLGLSFTFTLRFFGLLTSTAITTITIVTRVIFIAEFLSSVPMAPIFWNASSGLEFNNLKIVQWDLVWCQIQFMGSESRILCLNSFLICTVFAQILIKPRLNHHFFCPKVTFWTKIEKNFNRPPPWDCKGFISGGLFPRIW